MDFDKIIALIDEGKTDEVKTSLQQFKPTFEATVSELKAYEGKFSEAVQTRDKAKAKLKEFSEVIGIGSDELSADKVRELLANAKKDDASKAEIDNLTKLLQEKEAEFTSKITDYETRFRDKIIENEIAKLGAGSDVVNDKALGLVIQALKDGATIEEGQIVYRDASGATIRNGAGRPLTIAERMAEFKADGANAFLFKATSNGGGGSTGTHGGGGNNGQIPLDGDKQARLNAIKNKFLK